MQAYVKKIVLLLMVSIILTGLTGCSHDQHSRGWQGPDAGTEAPVSGGNTADEADEIVLKDMLYNGEGLYIAITSAGDILTSAAGPDQLEKQAETGIRLEAAVWGKGRCVAVGDEGMIITSEDGVHWNQKDSGTGANLYGVLWDGQRFIAAGGKILLTSKDGEEWVCREAPEINPDNGTSGNIALFYAGIFWDGTQYLTGGSGNYILSSEDLDKWTVISGDSLGSGAYYGFAWNSSRYVAVGDHFEIATSEDGWNWTKDGLNIRRQDSIDDYYTICIHSVVWGKDKFVAVGERGLILISDNGLDWSVVPPVTRAGLNRVIWDGRQYVAVGNGKTIITSINGVDWD